MTYAVLSSDLQLQIDYRILLRRLEGPILEMLVEKRTMLRLLKTREPLVEWKASFSQNDLVTVWISICPAQNNTTSVLHKTRASTFAGRLAFESRSL